MKANESGISLRVLDFDPAAIAKFSEIGLREFIAYCPHSDESSPVVRRIGNHMVRLTHEHRDAAIKELRRQVEARMGIDAAKPQE